MNEMDLDAQDANRANEALFRIMDNPGYISPAHRDAEGKLDPDKVLVEMRSKATQIAGAIENGGDVSTARDALGMVVITFPQHEAILKELVNETSALKQFSDMFEKDEDEK